MWKRFLSRKFPYLVGIIVLLLPISYLSMPPSGGAGGQAKAGGGVLAQMRREYDLSQASLGEIDPTSETIRLATLGLRNVAANILWYKANEYKKREDWYNLKASVDTITKLQPHFLTVWTFQAWNLAYNVSVEWDDYRDRYFWVKSGIEFLEKGTRLNKKEPTLIWEVGRIIAQKMGKSDEKAEFRKLFLADDEFHTKHNTPPDERDSWLVGKSFMRQAEQMVDTIPGARVKGTSPLVMHAGIPLNQIHYAEAIVKEGTFGEKARAAWQRSFREWAGTHPSDAKLSFGQRPVASPAGEIHMNDFEVFEQRALALRDELLAMDPTVEPRLAAERRAALTEEERKALDTPEHVRTSEQMNLVFNAQQKIVVPAKAIAEAMPPEKRAKAVSLAAAAEELIHIHYWVNRYGEICNFKYWRTRCLAEQTRNAQDAHEALYQARLAAPLGKFEAAQDAFEESMEHWRVTLEDYPLLLTDGLTGEDLLDVIAEYQKVLGHLDEKFPIKGYGLASAKEIVDWPKLAEALVTAKPGTPAARIWAWWGLKDQPAWAEGARNAATRLAKGTEGLTPEIVGQLEVDLQYGLNKTIKWTMLYEPEDFTQVQLREGLASKLSADRTEMPKREQRVLNRQLLEDWLGPQVLKPLPMPVDFVLANVLRNHAGQAEMKLHDLPAEYRPHIHAAGPTDAPNPEKAPPEKDPAVKQPETKQPETKTAPKEAAKLEPAKTEPVKSAPAAKTEAKAPAPKTQTPAPKTAPKVETKAPAVSPPAAKASVPPAKASVPPAKAPAVPPAAKSPAATPPAKAP